MNKIDEMLISGDARFIFGDVRYVVTRNGDIFSRAKGMAWKKLKTTVGNGRGHYIATTIGRHGRKLVHRVVARAFIGECPIGQEVRHLDGNHRNNHAENLAYGTRTQNMQDAVRHGTSPRGTRNPASILHENQVLEIRRRHALGSTQTQIAKEFGISIEAVSQIVRRTRWGWLDEKNASN